MKLREDVTLAIRIIAVLGAAVPLFFLLVFLCIMGTDSGTVGAIIFSGMIFIIGAVLLGTISVFLLKGAIAKRIKKG